MNPSNQQPEQQEEWKQKFEHWLINNLQLTSKSNVQLIIDHVERYIRPHPSDALEDQPPEGSHEGKGHKSDNPILQHFINVKHDVEDGMNLCINLKTGMLFLADKKQEHDRKKVLSLEAILQDGFL